MKISKPDTRVFLDASKTMYPSRADVVVSTKSQSLQICPTSTYYGYVEAGTVYIKGPEQKACISIPAGTVFSVPGSYALTAAKGRVWLVERVGFLGQLSVVVPERTGRLSYIDGCSDTLLVYPPRKGDPSVSSLYFPKNTQQTFHTHPSVRLGYVLSGKGTAQVEPECPGDTSLYSLEPGVTFLLDAHEKHRFFTEDSPMVILAFHPDGDWGPEDHNHTMVNRTYLR